MAEELTPEMSQYDRWKVEIDAAAERQKKFWKDGGKIDKRFKDDRGKGDEETVTSAAGDLPFRLNLFHANASTVMAMLYGRVPETDVSRRWADSEDDISRIGAEMLQRLLNISVQAPGAQDSDLLRACLQDFMLPGLGVARIRYEFEKETIPQRTVQVDPETGLETISTEEVEVVSNESAPLTYVHWRDFKWGYGRIWADVPWVSFTLYMTKAEATARFGAEIAEQLQYATKPTGTKNDPKNERHEDETWYRAEIEEIWEKGSRKVHWWSKDMKTMMETKDDPLKLKGFFPCPPPLAANCTTSMFLPTADFKLAQDLYNQIDVLQTRIGIITKAVKVVGVYDSGAKGVVRMMQEGVENQLIPVDSWAAFAEKGGLAGTVDWFPVADVVEALTKLEQLRDTHIGLLYQITGMADILRGHSEQYAGVGQEELKAKYASIRVQYLQDEFARFASDLMSLRAEVVRHHYEPGSIFVQSNAQFLNEDPQAVEAAIQFIKDPNNDLVWKVAIKPESIAMIDYAQLKAERTEYLTAVATFLQSSASMAEMAPEAVPALLEMLKWGLAGFKGGQQIEGVLDRVIRDMTEKAKNPPPPQTNPKVEEIQAKSQAEMQKQAQKANDEMMKMLSSHKAKLMEIAAEQNADLSVEQAQAFYNILESEVKFEFDEKLKKIDAQARRTSNA